MEKKFAVIVKLLHIIWAVAEASSYASFNFAASTMSGNTFTNGTASITIGSSSAYVEVPAISGVRSASGMIQMDFTNQVMFNEVLDFTSQDYYIGIQMHSYYQSSTYYLFCLPIKTTTGISTKVTANW